MNEFLIRCSSLSEIMTDPVTKAAKEAGELSQGAKSAVHRLVRYHLFNYSQPQIKGKEIQKGIMQEATAIDLLSVVTGEMYTKNEERRNNQWISGECDVLGVDHGSDVKCPWSLETFPLTSEEARAMAVKAGYHMQAAGYMMLWNQPKWSISYVMVDTPTELIPPWEDAGPHDLAGIPLSHRITQVNFERDLALEEKIKAKCEAAQRYAQDLIKRFKEEHP